MSMGNNPRLTPWGNWILMTVLGFILGSLVGFVASILAVISLTYLPIIVAEQIYTYLLLSSISVGVVVSGAIIAWLQWLVLRHWTDSSIIASWWWVVGTTIGWLGIFYTVTIFSGIIGSIFQPDEIYFASVFWDRPPSIAQGVLMLIITALFLGIFQALALKFKLSLALFWIFTNIFIFLIAALILFLWMWINGGMFGTPLFLVCFSPLYAAISGKVMTWLLVPSRM